LTGFLFECLDGCGVGAALVDCDRDLAFALVEITPLSATKRKPLDIEEIANYRQIDAADFGDMENDPFIKKLMAADGRHHH
jgi:hypothetical protein